MISEEKISKKLTELGVELTPVDFNTLYRKLVFASEILNVDQQMEFIRKFLEEKNVLVDLDVIESNFKSLLEYNKEVPQKNDFEDMLISSENKIPTGIASLDNVLQGGLARSHVNLLSGSAGAGKSMMALSVGAKALEDGLTVFHIVSESPEHTQRQYLHNICSIPEKTQYSEGERSELTRVANEISENLHIFSLENIRNSENGIAGFLRAHEHSAIDILIIDDLTALAHQELGENIQDTVRIGAVARTMQRIHVLFATFARQKNCVLLCTLPSRREPAIGYGRTNQIETVDTASSYFASMIAVIKRDEERPDCVRVNIRKNRNGPPNQSVVLNIDRGRSKIS